MEESEEREEIIQLSIDWEVISKEKKIWLEWWIRGREKARISWWWWFGCNILRSKRLQN